MIVLEFLFGLPEFKGRLCSHERRWSNDWTKKTAKDRMGQHGTTLPIEERVQRAFARIAALEQETPQKGAAPTPDHRIVAAIAPRIAALVDKGWSVRRIGAALERDGVMPAARFVRLWAKRNAKTNRTDSSPRAGNGSAANSEAHAAQPATGTAIGERAQAITPGGGASARAASAQGTAPTRREMPSQGTSGQAGGASGGERASTPRSEPAPQAALPLAEARAAR